MTTRAGLVGLGAGLLLSMALVYPLYFVWPGLCLSATGWHDHFWLAVGILTTAAALLVVLSGGLAAAWSGTTQPQQRLCLGTLAGGIVAITLFYSLGAAAGGTMGLGYGFRHLKEHEMVVWPVTETLLQITGWTHRIFWGLVLSGILLGALGGWQFAPASIMRGTAPASKNDPMMALNVSITTMPAAALAIILVVALFPRLFSLLQPDPIGTGGMPAQPLQAILNWPLTTSLLFYLAAQVALLYATFYEARQAEHRCGIDEVKVAAYVGILTPVLLSVVLGLLNLPLLLTPGVLGCLLISLGLVAWQISVLYSVILPRRAQMPASRDPVEATFFGTIAAARWQPLSLLCLGCSILMVAPIHVAVAAAINIMFIPISVAPAFTSVVGISAPTLVALVQHLYQVQAIAGWGAILAVALVLTTMYLCYNNLGRRFHDMRQKSDRAKSK